MPADATLAPWLAQHWQRFTEQLSNNRLPHALLLLGAEGVGKRSLSERMAMSLLCGQRAQDASACGHCQRCQLVVAGTHPDLHYCQPEPDSKVIKVDQIRALAAAAALTGIGSHRVFVVAPADRMNVNAANALLKTLEEPRPGSILLLLASARGRLPATILSRCQQILISQPPREQALGWLGQHSDAAAAELGAALTAAAGSPGRALEFIEQDLLEVLEQTVSSLERTAAGVVEPVAAAAGWVDDWLGQRLDWLSRWLVAMAAPDSAGERVPAGLGALVVQGSAKSLIILAERVNRGRGLLESAARPELIVEELLIAWRRLFATQRA